MSVIYGDRKVYCTTCETKLWLSPFAKQCQNPCSRYPPVYQDLITFHAWPVKKDLIDLPIRVKENQNALPIIDSFRAQNNDLSVSLQTSLAKAVQSTSANHAFYCKEDVRNNTRFNPFSAQSDQH